MEKKSREWFRQADYDIKSAQVMFENKRYIYAIFMSHLALEKALKGLYAEKFDKTPPKTHNLTYLAEKIEIELPEDMYDFMFTLSGVSVQMRYPDALQKARKEYNRTKTKALLDKSMEALKWLRAMS